MCNITIHGNQRVRKRCGISKKAVENKVNRAYENGIKHSDCRGSLKRYVDKLYLSERSANNIRLYENKAWLFRDELLITTFEIPPKYRKTVKNILEKCE